LAKCYWNKENKPSAYTQRASGQSGDIVVSLLTKSKSAKGKTSPPEIGFSGNITKGGLLGSLKGKEISDLVSLMSNGSAYVNIHTDKYPKGAIRGQITTTVMSENGVTSSQTNDNATSTEQPSSMNNGASSQSENSTQQNVAFTNQSTSTSNLDVDASMK
jgi:hypothetical protein